MKESDIRKRTVFNRYLELVAEDVKDFFDVSMFSPVPCPACASKKNSAQYIKTGFTYVRCDECRTIFVSPRPPYETLSRFYAESPSTQFWIRDFFMPVAEARREKIFKPRAEYVKTLLPEGRQLVIGDIGAGIGLFLEELKKILPQHDYMGIEPSYEMAEQCRTAGIRTVPLFLESLEGYDASFDFLAGFEIMEHVYDPYQFLSKVYTLLKPGGYCMVTTLNGEGFDIMVLGEQSKSVSPPHHLNFFNTDSLPALFKRVGFSVVEVATPGKLDWSIVEGMITDEKVACGALWEHVAQSVTPQGKEALQQWITNNNLSSHMRVVVRK